MDKATVDIKPIDLVLKTEEMIDDRHARNRMSKYGMIFESKRFADVQLGIRNSSET